MRKYLREQGVNPDSFEFIRSAQSQIRYSQLGTRDNAFEEHRDGEIYAGAMWDLRELMVALQPKQDFVRPDPVTGDPTQETNLGKETWERIFLGSMYVLGVSAPDTFVRARDAVLIADAALYPTDPLDLTSPGRHHALIERVFAARELGANAKAPIGGRQTISTVVSEFTANQAKPAAPETVVAVPDLDFELLDAEGNIMASSGNLGSNEQVGGGIVPGETYRVRVNGWANGPTSYRVVIDQFVSDINDANVDQNGNATTGTVTFEFNPVTGKVSPLDILN